MQFLGTLQGYKVLCANKACWFGNKLKQGAAGALLYDCSFFKRVCWKYFRRRDMWVKSLNVSTGRPDTELLLSPESTSSFKTEEIDLCYWESLSGSRRVPAFVSKPLATEKNREQSFEIMVEWRKNKILFPWKLDGRRTVVGYCLTKSFTLSLMKSNSAWKRTSTVPSPPLFYPARGQSYRFRQILQQVLEIHHIMYLLFLPQLWAHCRAPFPESLSAIHV